MFEAVREARERRGVSQMRCAQAAGRSLSWFQQCEAGCLRPSREDAEAVARLLGEPVDSLFTRVREVA